MRPTFLNFRSPKDLTPDFYCPKVTNDGKPLLESSYLPPGMKFNLHGAYPYQQKRATSKSPLKTINETNNHN
jgi:hypothetical protein